MTSLSLLAGRTVEYGLVYILIRLRSKFTTALRRDCFFLVSEDLFTVQCLEATIVQRYYILKPTANGHLTFLR